MNKISSIFSIALVCFSLCGGTTPGNWLSNHQRAKSLAKSRNLPIMVLFVGAGCKNSADYTQKLVNSPEISALIAGNVVPLYVELPPGGSWSADFKQQLQTTYPFLKLEYGIALPALYFTDSDFNDLKVREPRATASGFAKAVSQSREALAQRPAPALMQNVPTMHSVTAESRKPALTSRMQMREANRQKRANTDPSGDPPVGWFTDPEKAREFAESRKLPIMWLFSGTDWCGPCKNLRQKVLDTPALQQLVVEQCVALYIHVPRGGWNEVRRKYPFWKARGVPSFVFTDDKFKVIPSTPTYIKRSLEGFTEAIRKAAAKLK